MTVANKIRFMGNNHLTAEGTIYTAPSAHTSYPFTNALDDFRSKYWRPAGNFTINSTNNKLHLDVGGSPVTVTITSGNYDGPYYLYTQLNSDLSTAGYGSIVFNYNYTTGKFNVTGSGQKLALSVTTNAIWDTIGFTTTSDITLNATAVNATQTRSMTSEKITIDFGYNALCRFIGIISPLDSSYVLSSLANVTIKANNINDFTAPPFSETASWSSGGHLQFFDSYEDLDLTYRYWQIEIEDKLNVNLLLAGGISYIYLGDYTTIESGNINNGFNITLVDPSIIDVSESGVKYFDKKTKYYEFSSCIVGFLENTDRENMMQLFYDLGVSTPFFISLDPQLVGSSTIDELTKFVHFKDSPQFKHVVKNIYTMSFDLAEVV